MVKRATEKFNIYASNRITISTTTEAYNGNAIDCDESRQLHINVGLVVRF